MLGCDARRSPAGLVKPSGLKAATIDRKYNQYLQSKNHIHKDKDIVFIQI
jgi:hypothetical protein